MNYDLLFQNLKKFRKENKIEQGFNYTYTDWYKYRFCFSHQMATRGDEKWFATQVGGSTEGTGKKLWPAFNREVDIGDGFCGPILRPGENNYDLKVTYQDRSVISSIGFQQYRPADPIAFYAAFMGTDESNYTLIMVPKDVAFKMKLEKIERTGKLGSAHGTGLYDKMTLEEKLNVLENASKNGESCVIGFDVKKTGDKENFELLMDKYRMKLHEVSNFVLSYRIKNGI